MQTDNPSSRVRRASASNGHTGYTDETMWVNVPLMPTQRWTIHDLRIKGGPYLLKANLSRTYRTNKDEDDLGHGQ